MKFHVVCTKNGKRCMSKSGTEYFSKERDAKKLVERLVKKYEGFTERDFEVRRKA